MTTQIALRLPDEVVRALDALVERGTFPTRSEAVRVSIEALLRSERRRAVEAAFEEGFRRAPERAEELAQATRLAIEAIEDEPWDPWW